MDTRPEPPPEGRLIDDARARAGISVRGAARRAGISNTRWNQIVKGSHAPARTIARMARAAGVTPGQLAAEGGRPDAAEILAGLLAADAPRVPLAAAADPAATRAGLALAAEMTRIAAEIQDEIGAARRRGVPEGEIFGDEAEAALWAIPLMGEADRALRIAALRSMRPPAAPPWHNDPPETIELAG